MQTAADKEQSMEKEWKEEENQEWAEGRYTSDSPDCEGCIFNFGNLNCAVYDIKPAAIVIEHKPCEKRRQGGTV